MVLIALQGKLVTLKLPFLVIQVSVNRAIVIVVTSLQKKTIDDNTMDASSQK